MSPSRSKHAWIAVVAAAERKDAEGDGTTGHAGASRMQRGRLYTGCVVEQKNKNPDKGAHARTRPRGTDTKRPAGPHSSLRTVRKRKRWETGRREARSRTTDQPVRCREVHGRALHQQLSQERLCVPVSAQHGLSKPSAKGIVGAG